MGYIYLLELWIRFKGGLAPHFFPLTLPCLIVGGVVLPILPKKRLKMAIFENIIKDFEKSKRVEALKWYFLHPLVKRNNLSYTLPPSLEFLKIFCLPPHFITTPPTIRHGRVFENSKKITSKFHYWLYIWGSATALFFTTS